MDSYLNWSDNLQAPNQKMLSNVKGQDSLMTIMTVTRGVRSIHERYHAGTAVLQDRKYRDDLPEKIEKFLDYLKIQKENGTEFPIIPTWRPSYEESMNNSDQAIGVISGRLRCPVCEVDTVFGCRPNFEFNFENNSIQERTCSNLSTNVKTNFMLSVIMISMTAQLLYSL